MNPEKYGEIEPRLRPEVPRAYLDLQANVLDLTDRLSVEDKADQSAHELMLNPLDIPSQIVYPNTLEAVNSSANITSLILDVNRSRDAAQNITSFMIGLDYSDESSISMIIDQDTLSQDYIAAESLKPDEVEASITQVPTEEVVNFIISLEHPIKNGSIVAIENDDEEGQKAEIDPTFLLQECFIDPLVYNMKDHAFGVREKLRYVVNSPNAKASENLESSIEVERDNDETVMISIDDEVFKKLKITPDGKLSDTTLKRKMEILFTRYENGLSFDVEFFELRGRIGVIEKSILAHKISADELDDYIRNFMELVKALNSRFEEIRDIPVDPNTFA